MKGWGVYIQSMHRYVDEYRGRCGNTSTLENAKCPKNDSMAIAKNGFSRFPGNNIVIGAAAAGSGRVVRKFWYPRTKYSHGRKILR